ncbi:utp25, u3 small nucleolar RNA-associated SSU processome protein 25 domain-containing protein [Hirsutella rhossiliensis]|uniref:U3 small nucleolar RNA-associated protein 25 n=1 Tax=Hirsutella rhossiliensis TaxID=111463 RepID=A0A9P8SI54_9HYPO|nr:utp25, u3 small nucleolar RNA-associated SSU processome protein 25 domain-containing protein [Hirsutella rhossiliensis]KAH0963843.1 utp25, u3 small nucleolar RNA-associated SSU processome protein 25 domain-containing protein [Hirsutella rhossiliensis]
MGGRDQDEMDDSELESSSDDAQEEDLDSAVSEDGDDEEPPSRPYMALLQSLNESSNPKAKRRKLEHPASPQQAPSSLSHQRENGDDEEPEDVDKADEEEEPTVDPDEQPQSDSDSEDGDASADPFDAHIAQPDKSSVAKSVQAVKDGQWTTKRALIQSLRTTLMSPGLESALEVPESVAQVDALKLKQKLRETASTKMSNLDASQRALMPLLFEYRDVLHCDRTVANSHGLRQLVCLHALNHAFKTRDRVIKNNYKLAKEREDTDLEFRDQGFTRPKVLFLLPTRNSCTQMVNIIRELCEPEQQENRKRFEESYVEKSSSFGDDRPADFKNLFEGNDDDMFRIGVKFTRKTIKYFAQFYNSDILLASPLGLRMAMGSEEDKKKPDFDFLSSIELVVVDHADALLMQNWEHVEYIFEHLNKQPKDAHGCDFSRVRHWYLDDMAKFFRQTVVLSAFNTPELSELARLHCHNWAGRARLQPEYPGAILQLGIKVKQAFSRFQSSSVDNDPDARFEYFVSAIVPTLVKRAKDSTGTLLFVPSYLDFVRVRNYFANSPTVSSVTFGAISEYTDVPEASRARSHFLSGRHRVLLYTERAHHFRRYQLRGVHRVVFYSLPDNPIFYREIAGEYLAKSEQDLRIEPGQGTVRVMFSRYDVMKLERVVGSKRVAKMMQERGDTFDFV